MTATRFLYTSSDAWVLLAIVYAGGENGAELSDIVGAGDYINHAIFTYGELQDALSKLTSDGFVREEGGRFFPAAAALDFRSPRRAAKKTHAVATDFEEMTQFLRPVPWSPGSDEFPQEFTYAGVTEDDFGAAVQAYSKQIRAVTAKDRRPRRKKSP